MSNDRKEFICDVCGITENEEEKTSYVFGTKPNGKEVTYKLLFMCSHCYNKKFELEHEVLFPRLLQYGQHLKHARRLTEAAEKYLYEDVRNDLDGRLDKDK
jgi:hypothetical protein